MKPSVDRSWLLTSTALLSGFLLTACGGGGGGGVNTTPPPPVATPAPTPPPPVSTPPPTTTPAPTPTPAPPPTPGSFDTAEYRATVGAVSLNALAAYQRNATGAGINVGIVDSGIDIGSEEFAGRISAASANTAGGNSTDDEDGHGTAVAFTIAGRRNGAGSHGVAFDASLIIARADAPGSCATTGADAGCNFTDTAIARGIDLARTNGARVVNLSLGGSAPDQSVVAAINRATAAGIIIIVSAGNDFADKPAEAINPDLFAQIANNDAVSRNLVIIAGSIGETDAISGFSNRAGNSAAHYLAAVGERVRAPCENTSVCLWSGTSFAAPQIAGAVALLAQAFPNLSGAQIVSILFSSARDAGAAGRDGVYGNGVLDLTRAFSPLGATSVAGGSGAMSLDSNATLSAPIGDARQGTLGAVILDGYSRAFAIDLARTIERQAPQPMLFGMLGTTTRSVSRTAGGMTVAMTITGDARSMAVERTLLSPGDARVARAVAGIVTSRMGHDTEVAFGIAEGGAALGARLRGHAEPAFLIARDPSRAAGFDSAVRGSSAVRRQFGPWGVTAAMESGAVLSRDTASFDPSRYRRSGYDRSLVSVDRQLGRFALTLAATRLGERDTLLGARFGAGLGATRATSWFVDSAARVDAGRGWSLGGSLRHGWTLADVRAGLSGGGTIRTNAFAADIGKYGVVGRRDSLGLRIAQPLRVSRGGIDLKLPVNYDYATLGVDAWATQRLNLAPQGREIDIEARYGFPLWLGQVETNLFWRRDPGNYAALPDDRGAAVRYSVAF